MIGRHLEATAQPEYDEPETLDRDFGGSSKSGRSLGKKALGILKYAGSTIQSGAKYLKVEGQVSKDLLDAQRFPELSRQAQIRRGLDLCPAESAWLAARKARVRDSFARYMGWDPSLVHPDDVPTMAFGGSGGGYRAMLAMLGYSLAMKQSGLWDMLAYVAGVSGSCKLATHPASDPGAPSSAVII